MLTLLQVASIPSNTSYFSWRGQSIHITVVSPSSPANAGHRVTLKPIKMTLEMLDSLEASHTTKTFTCSKISIVQALGFKSYPDNKGNFSWSRVLEMRDWRTRQKLKKNKIKITRFWIFIITWISVSSYSYSSSYLLFTSLWTDFLFSSSLPISSPTQAELIIKICSFMSLSSWWSGNRAEIN